MSERKDERKEALSRGWLAPSRTGGEKAASFFFVALANNSF